MIKCLKEVKECGHEIKFRGITSKMDAKHNLNGVERTKSAAFLLDDSEVSPLKSKTECRRKCKQVTSRK